MIFSMTGYGRAEGLSGGRQLIVEIKSLNGKTFELNNRFSPILKAYETEIRKMLLQRLKRGSVDISVSIRQDGAAKPMRVNTSLARYYFQAMESIARELDLDWESEKKNALVTLMRMPEIIAADTDNLPEEDWTAIQKLTEQAAEQLKAHREAEGRLIAADISLRIEHIEQLQSDITTFEAARLSRIRQRIMGSLDEWVAKEKIDANRLEQELIFYVEKIDFSEEKQRLSAHCTYFKQLLAEAGEEGIGKKLGFILQEIGREINTLGSKANDASIQKIVVNMKDELEKAKEQSLNIL
jgi:uncharacterized protein (TIGR00255 family)